MLQALAPLARSLAPIAETALQGVAQGVGQQLADSGTNAIKSLMNPSTPQNGAISYADAQPQDKQPATY